VSDEGVVRLEGVRKAFGDRAVLDGVSFEVRRGRGFCLLGRSGTGKSVTLRHIVGLVRPDAGQVLVEGRDVPRLSRRELSEVRQRIGFLFQGAALFDSISVGENVAFPSGGTPSCGRRRSGGARGRGSPRWASRASTTGCRRRSRAA